MFKRMRPHEFWWQTCGVDTYWRSAKHARHDTPWNAFTADGGALVCTLWVDLMVHVHDPEQNRVRRFVRMGDRTRKWQGVAMRHGKDSRDNLEKAIKEKLPVFGYEAEPNNRALDLGKRNVNYFYADRKHQLKAWIGLSYDKLERQLSVRQAFEQNGSLSPDDHNLPPILFELVEGTTEVQGIPVDEDLIQADLKDEDEIVQIFDGNLPAQEYARMALPMLVAHVLQQTDGVLVPITYLRLAELLGRREKSGEPWARGLGHVLGLVTALIESAYEQSPETVPFLTSIIVLSSGVNVGLPGQGVSGRWHGYTSLCREDKQAKVAAEYKRILEFGSRWNEVLRRVGLAPIALPLNDSGHPESGGWGGGESEDHKALKRYVRDHPDLVGAAADWDAQEEYVLRSLDEIDVMFKSEPVWIGVEVKSKVSDKFPSDYERGIYQVVKYRAVLEAQARIDHPANPPKVRVILALESGLPKEYRRLADLLNVNYLEHIEIKLA
jgi:hypothetical protein